MSDSDLPADFLAQLGRVTGKRARIVIEHILAHGHVTTEQLERLYGYKHPPRAIKDVRDQGIPLITERVRSSDGRTIASYRFGDPEKVRTGRIGGRRGTPHGFRAKLFEQGDGCCASCDGRFELRELQVDHRIPYEIAGDDKASYQQLDSSMILCPSCSRSKSWSCEQCPNWQDRIASTCEHCYWAYPLDHSHVATTPVRRMELLFQGEEVTIYKQLSETVSASERSLQDEVKRIVRDFLSWTLT